MTRASLLLGIVALAVLAALLAGGRDDLLPYFILVVIPLGIVLWYRENRRA